MFYLQSWNLIDLSIEAMGFFIWGFPLISLGILSYAIEHYTHFQTRWRLFLIASSLTFAYPIGNIYYTLFYGQTPIEIKITLTSLLLLGLVTAAFASIKLLGFQHIDLGRTKNTIRILSVFSIVVPATFWTNGVIGYAQTLQMIGYNLAITAMILIILAIGKLTQNYIPHYQLLAYSSARLSSMILLIDPLIKNLTSILQIQVNTISSLYLIGALTQIASMILLLIPVIMLIMEAQVRGVHIIPLKEEKSGKPIRYKLSYGLVYLIQEENAKKSTNIFVEYISHQHHGLMLTRTQPTRVRQQHELLTTPILWMTNAKTDEKSVKPQDIDRINYIIQDFIRYDADSVILIQRLDYLITENDFKTVLKFIHTLNDTIQSTKCIVLVSIDPSTQQKDNMAMLLAELEDLTNIDKVALGEPLYSILLFVHNENNNRKMPSFKNITKRFDITKTTARKRIYELEQKGLIRITTEGRYKYIEITEKGKGLIGSPVQVMGVE